MRKSRKERKKRIMKQWYLARCVLETTVVLVLLRMPGPEPLSPVTGRDPT